MELIPPQVLRGTRRAISMELHSGGPAGDTVGGVAFEFIP